MTDAQLERANKFKKFIEELMPLREIQNNPDLRLKIIVSVPNVYRTIEVNEEDYKIEVKQLFLDLLQAAEEEYEAL